MDRPIFRFKIGDIVHHSLTSPKRFDDESVIKTSLLIVGRVTHECSAGGEQLFYECRLGIASGSPSITFEPSKLYLFHEGEVE